MKNIRITLYIFTVIYGLSIVFFHIDFIYKKPILYFLIGALVIFDLIIPNFKKNYNREK